jgi:nitrate reductase alpha subunit
LLVITRPQWRGKQEFDDDVDHIDNQHDDDHDHTSQLHRDHLVDSGPGVTCRGSCPWQ